MTEIVHEIRGVRIRASRELCNQRYQVERILAAGGQGFVMIARDRHLSNNQVLIKAPLYSPGSVNLGMFSFGQEREQRHADIMYEIAVVRNLNEFVQNIPRVIDYFEDDNLNLIGSHLEIGGQNRWEIRPGDENCRDLFVVYELLSSGSGEASTLEDVINAGTVSNERFVLEMARQIAEVLFILHTDNEPEPEHKEQDPTLQNYYYLYQDLKPANILVTGDIRTPYFFLIDFGGVTRCDVRHLDRSFVSTIQRGTGAYTVGYAAPEMFEKREQLNRQFDIFSLGATMFHAFTGVHPAKLLPDKERECAPEFPAHQLDSQPAFETLQNPLLREIIFISTRPALEDRYASIQQMQSDINLALKNCRL